MWLCDCNPRQPANHFKVRKPGRNKYKWFRTCQKQQNDKSRCNFFLWDSDAHPREVAAVASNSRTEPMPTDPQTPMKRPSPYIGPSGVDSTRKRRRITDIDMNDE
ncbi:hypothetical protein B5807_01009 [Epicoccum nigrum]|uniref:GRF-type domain-containing protein n=1 Tax=Epicoccum nigrum TaxID=105696 RepID=A0A1Y2MEP6_EPING|nr:hypothetical protein B5807_01009 [Epicoccum nigrum]